MAAAEILRALPANGPLFSYLRTVRCGDRTTEFKQRCDGLGIEGVSLHSYRYAWAKRAKQAGYPERLAQEPLGHNSKAIHRAYARKAQVELPPLSEYERSRYIHESGQQDRQARGAGHRRVNLKLAEHQLAAGAQRYRRKSTPSGSITA